ncbi:hypothetical protein AB0H83_14390 [Dactylosporangium sp. NPDC050688]|uniref:hypothetical protein n=1 Tax=Dactylosporangium sp. NPDC050688 TaxID=3157217 RepID=UPI0033EADF1F
MTVTFDVVDGGMTDALPAAVTAQLFDLGLACNVAALAYNQALFRRTGGGGRGLHHRLGAGDLRLHRAAGLPAARDPQCAGAAGLDGHLAPARTARSRWDAER